MPTSTYSPTLTVSRGQEDDLAYDGAVFDDGALLDADTEDTTTVTPDGRDVTDFDFAQLVGNLDLSDIDRAAEQLEAEKAPYAAAARRAGKKNGAAEYFNEVNGPLFTRRRAMLDELALLDAIPSAERGMAQRRQARRLRRMVDSITALIVRLNYGMTRNYVRVFTSTTSSEDSDDFQGAAIVGLMNSIDTFDPAKGRFGSWAYKRIQREVLRAVRDADFANMNHGDFEKRPEVLRARAALAGPDSSYTPTFAEIAEKAGCTVELVTRVLNAPYLESLHTPLGEDGDTELGDLLPDKGDTVEDQVTSSMDVAALVEYGLPVLDTREHYVIVRRFGLDGEPVQCLSSIGKQLNLSREAVRQIEGKGLAKLLHPRTLRKLARHGRA